MTAGILEIGAAVVGGSLLIGVLLVWAVLRMVNK